MVRGSIRGPDKIFYPNLLIEYAGDKIFIKSFQAIEIHKKPHNFKIADTPCEQRIFLKYITYIGTVNDKYPFCFN